MRLISLSPLALFRLGLISFIIAGGILAGATIFSVWLDSGDADIYIKETIVGDGDWRTLHGGKLSEESGGQNATLHYKYDKTVDESGSQDQNLEVTIEGGDGSRWTFVRLGAENVAGHNTVDIYIGSIEGTAYVKNGMKVSYNEANESREEFVSNIEVDTSEGNAIMRFDIVQRQGAGEPIPQYDEETGNFTGYEGGESMGKPVSISDLDLVGAFVINQLAELKEPIKDEKGWLEFCDTLDDKLPDGFIVMPSGMIYDWQNGTAWNKSTEKVYQIDV